MSLDGNAVVYCEGAFASTYGKTAHGLIRFTDRYDVVALIDSTLAGQDAGQVLDRKASGIPIVANLGEALNLAEKSSRKLTHFVIGIATDGGVMDSHVAEAVLEALGKGLNIDSGLHDFLCDIPEIFELAEDKGLVLRDIRKVDMKKKHPFTGKIEEVLSKRIAILGTDSAIGKRTTSWLLVQAIRKAGMSAELIGTGQTAWMQGAKYGIILDSLLNDFVSGELEHAIWSAWKELKMDYAVIEGQGSLMNPGYPGGFEIMAAGRPHGIIMQHAPFRMEYDGFPGYALDSLNDQIHAVEFLSKKPVIAVTVNHEGIPPEDIDQVCRDLERECKRTVVDPLVHGVGKLIPLLKEL
ncbi:DUF1611 domain-containing protein [Oceanispirochaeta crateris]|uniref:DUF1611 domain-containing protein n=1 Tax=Oceanispirochaeta crateris TaxID=2518645 RepID=A0A5C1QKP5_9SPIO|nr:DUF1611 domain-containing protein [Oceanispirochaeta crateris]QEN08683.1 DUF1611 domain-containing protein [Oceanispirochaeta crateris]